MKRLFMLVVMASLASWGGANEGTMSIDRSSSMKGTPDGSLSPPGTFALRNNGNNGAFLVNAYHEGILDIAAAEIALRNSSNPDIKQLAENTINDRTQTNNRIRQLALEKHIALPYQLPADFKKILEDLSNLSGNEFDLTYLHYKLMAHELQASRFSQYAIESSTPDIRNFAANTLVVLQAHLQAARIINGKVYPAG